MCGSQQVAALDHKIANGSDPTVFRLHSTIALHPSRATVAVVAASLPERLRRLANLDGAVLLTTTAAEVAAAAAVLH